MKLMKELEELPLGFDDPTALPSTQEERARWQNANQSWWEKHPMRYDWKDAIPYEEFSREFFAEIDCRFFSLAALYLPFKEVPFDPLIDFKTLATKDVLEVGVGSGSHAQLLAAHSRTFTGIDLTDYAIRSTKERMRVFNLNGNMLRMDAEHMEFPDGSFDFIWSWGVIHHSANTRRILEEMHRVLRPGGEVIVMVYHRTLWEYHLQGSMLAILAGRGFTPAGVHESIQRRTDGAIARYYKSSEWKALVSDLFSVMDLRVYGKKTELVPLPAGRVKDQVVEWIPDAVSRFLTNTCGWGSFLVTRLRKGTA